MIRFQNYYEQASNAFELYFWKKNMKYKTLYKSIVLGISIMGIAASAQADDQTMSGSGASFNLGEVKVTLGGFVAAETYDRNRGLASDIDTNFGGSLPLAGSDAYHMNNFGGTARQSRLSLLIQGPEINGIKPEAYYEGDFLGSAVTSNSKQSNSYTPRVRQVFADFTTDYGLQVLAGQAWSLATQNKIGIVTRKINSPLILPVIPHYFDFQGSIVSGKGIGRYGTSQLPDYTTHSDGSISAIRSTKALVGLVGHPIPALTLI